MNKKPPFKIAVLPGDGIGVDVVEAALQVFEVLNLPITYELGDIGWEFWQQKGNPVPQCTWDLIERSDLTILGAITSMPKKEAELALPKTLQNQGIEYVSPIIQLRQNLDLYANVRPCYSIKGSSEPFDFTIIRENTEGLYSGFDYHPVPRDMQTLLQGNPRWKDKNFNEVSASIRLQSREGLTRLYSFAFEYAQKNNYKRVTLADKPNVLRQSSAFAREIFESIAMQYSDIAADILNVDAIALWMIRKPHEFGVIVAENMFGDILSDLGAGVMGGLGFAASANIGNKGAYFEPVHGSAPRVKKNTANPCAMFLTISLMLEHLGMNTEAKRIKNAIATVLKLGKHLTYDLGGHASTQDMANSIIDDCLKPKINKQIAILSTGNELLTGTVQDKNGPQCAQAITQSGGQVTKLMTCGDSIANLKKSIQHLLENNDALIITGGLGPTTDDNTRYALSDVTKKPLRFYESSWNHIKERFKRFGLTLTESNKKQAYFPDSSHVLKNEHGTANGCYLKWQGRNVFMLPGPPKECQHLFEQYVAPILKEEGYYIEKAELTFLTMGLIEAEISEQVDDLAKIYDIIISYCWQYPFLSITVTAMGTTFSEVFLDKLSILLKGHVVSDNGEHPTSLLKNILNNVDVSCHLQIKGLKDISKLQLAHKKLSVSSDNTEDNTILKLECNIVEPLKTSELKVVKLSVLGTSKAQICFTETITTPIRNEDIELFYREFIAWKVVQLIKNYKVI